MLSHSPEVLFSLLLHLVLFDVHPQFLPSVSPLFPGREKLLKWFSAGCWPCSVLGFEL